MHRKCAKNRLNFLSQHAAFVSVSCVWEVPRAAQSWQGSYTETRRFDQKTVEREREKSFLVEKGRKKWKRGKWEKVKEKNLKKKKNCGEEKK